MLFKHITGAWHLSKRSPALHLLLLGTLTSALTPSPAIGLLTGLTISALNLNERARAPLTALSKRLLHIAVALLGAGLKIDEVLRVGYESIGVTLGSISATLTLGLLLGGALRVERTTALLVSGGTAICGGSAIAALAPSVSASAAQTAVAMIVIFSLNALSLLIFPPLGAALGLTEAQFGLWSALAIHDTSSVVGAAAAFGGAALGVATTVKLTRALWILPLSLISARLHGATSKAPFPWFLLAFLAVALARSLSSHLPVTADLSDLFDLLAASGKRLMVLTLFCVGAGLNIAEVRQVGARPFALGVALWVIVSAVSAWLISRGWLATPASLGT